MYVAILNVAVNPNTKQRVFGVAISNDASTSTLRQLTENQLAMEIVRGKHKLVNGRVAKNGKIESPFGSFDRLKPQNGVSPVVALATVESSTGRTVGYVVVTQQGVISKIRKEDILVHCENAKKKGVALVQNMIYRITNDVPQLAEFPEQDLPTIVLSKSNPAPQARKPEPEKPVVPVRKPPVQQNTAPQNPVATPTPASAPTPEMIPQRAVRVPTPLTEKQNKEIEAAKNAGVNPMIVDSPKLKPAQQRVIWAAKKNGIKSEYFSNPKFNREQMVFLADRLESDESFRDCMALVDPKYSVEQMRELYLGISNGIDVTDMLDENLSAEDMYVKRCQLEADAGFTSFEELMSGSSLSQSSEACIRRFAKRHNFVAQRNPEEQVVEEAE